MNNENKTVITDYNDDKLANIKIEDEEMDLYIDGQKLTPTGSTKTENYISI